MALQVWLPLNGDLHNQGLTQVTVTNNGATVDNTGKIGKCYKFGTAASYVDVSKEAMTSCTSGASVCFWLKINTFNSNWATVFQAGTNSAPWLNYIFGFLRNNNTSKYCFAIGNGTDAGTSKTSFLTPNLSTGVWYHFAMTYKTGHLLAYINGELHNDWTTSIVPNFASITRITLGKCNDRSSYQSDCYVNDFRIYDHCLSPKEIKEISKGLVLHYKLDDPYVEGTTNLNQSNWAAYTNYWTIQSQTRDEIKLRKNTSSSSDTVALTNSGLLAQLSAGDKVTVSGYLYKGDIPYKSTAGCVTTYTSYYTTNSFNSFDNGYFVCTMTVKTVSSWEMHASLFGDCSDGDICYIRKLQWEKKDHATPYTPSSRTPSTVYDCSGYNHNGFISGSTVSIESPSPRFDKCILSNNPTVYSILESQNLNLPDGPMTLSFWSKPTVSTTEDTSNIELTFSKIKYFTYINYPYFIHDSDYHYKYINYWSDGLWHHVTCVYTGSGLQMYIDGNLISPSVTTTTTNFSNSLNIKFRKNNLSDFRIYATALSEYDVKELYDTSAYIYNDGSIAAFEFDEINTASRELHPYPNKNNSTHIEYLSDGSYRVSGQYWVNADYIPINPVDKIYYYDIEYSNVEGNHFFIGFEKYDSEMGTGQNQSCQYQDYGTSAANHKRITGTINLLNVGNGNISAYTRLRILNNWYNQGDENSKVTIHHISLKEVSSLTVSDIKRSGIFEGDTFIEDNDASISKTGNVIGNQIKEI